ncbi:MAG: helix-turn-helix transcriptional regulator [Roseivirga sp.]|nr:helix-turn-helix transcriptional regulator [Roseivirga sp.]
MLVFRTRNIPNSYIAILILLFSISLLHLVLESSIHAFNSKFPFPMEFGFSYGPLAYLHILHIKNPMRRFMKKDLLHFIPTLVLEIILFITLALYARANMDWVYANIPLIQTISLSMYGLAIIQFSIYTYLIHRESKDTQSVLKDFVRVRKWLAALVTSWIIVIGFLTIAVPIALLFVAQLDDNSAWLYIPLGVIMSLWIFVIGYLYLIKYAEIITNYMDKVKRFKFSKDEFNNKKDQLINALTQDELYKDPKLTVAKLAGNLGWPINSVSTMINESLQTNFNDLINQHRIAAFKQLLLEPESNKYSIVGLGQEAGFSSKASFYRAFKKETGMTPSDFIKSQS